MSRVRYEIGLEIDVVTPLHLGTGDTRRVAGVGDAGDNAGAEVAAIARDVNGDPTIPSTSVKGLLRRLGEAAEGLDDERLAALFGDRGASGEGAGARAGCVLVRGGLLKESASADKMPFANAKPVSEGGLGAGVFVAARTAIDAEKGIAADHKLQHAEMVAPGARFALGLVVEARSPDAERRAEVARAT